MYIVLDIVGVGVGGICNISGIIYVYVMLECELVDLYDKEVVLLFILGYVLNWVMLGMFGVKILGFVILLDVFNYVLMIEGICYFCV